MVKALGASGALCYAAAGRTVVDFGCGEGSEAIEIAQAGAAKVIGVDIRPEFLVTARQRAETAGVSEKCEFTASPTEPADIVVSIDSFEHFEDPAAILQIMHSLLRPGGKCSPALDPLGITH